MRLWQFVQHRQYRMDGPGRDADFIACGDCGVVLVAGGDIGCVDYIAPRPARGVGGARCKINRRGGNRHLAARATDAEVVYGDIAAVVQRERIVDPVAGIRDIVVVEVVVADRRLGEVQVDNGSERDGDRCTVAVACTLVGGDRCGVVDRTVAAAIAAELSFRHRVAWRVLPHFAGGRGSGARA